jgi:hypothetical protein
MMQNLDRLRGRLRFNVIDPDGAVVAERRGENIVVRQGAQIVAALLSGGAAARPINRVQVGFGRETTGVDATALTPPADGNVAAEALSSAVSANSFTMQTDRPGVLQLFITTSFAPTVDLEGVSEAGLMAGDSLYNQVVFEPITLRVGQNVTFFWEVDLPYGR